MYICWRERESNVEDVVVWSTSEGGHIYLIYVGERESNVEDLVVWSTSEGVYICWRERVQC